MNDAAATSEPTPGPAIRVLLADDQVLLRGSLRVLVDAEPGFVTTAEAATGT